MSPVEGGQWPGSQWEGVASEVPISWALYLPRPTKCHLCPTGDGPRLRSIQGRCSRQHEKMSSAFYAAGLTIPLNMTTFGLIIYGGTIPVDPSTTVTCRNALAETFDVASNLTSWREVGAVPHTRKCLTNSKVRHDGTDETSIRTSSPKMISAPPS